MSTEYIHFTTEQREAAQQTDLVALLQSQGEQLKRSGKEYVWRDGSEKVTVRGNLWFHQYERIGGDAVDFVRRFYNMDFPHAVNFLLDNNSSALPSAESVKREPPKPFALPPKNDNMRRVYAYLLNRRGIDREVLSAFVHKGMVYTPLNDISLADKISKNSDIVGVNYTVENWEALHKANPDKPFIVTESAAFPSTRGCIESKNELCRLGLADKNRPKYGAGAKGMA